MRCCSAGSPMGLLPPGRCDQATRSPTR
jgi:hypothetical protein